MRKFFARILAPAFLLLLSACGTVAIPEPPDELALAESESLGIFYELGPGDELDLFVFDNPEVSGPLVVDEAGALAVPLIGAVPVNGMTVREVEQDLTARFGDGYLVNPRLSLRVTQYRSFYILGGVQEAGDYEYRTGLTILNAIALAGGYNDLAAVQSPPRIIRATDPGRRLVEVTVYDPVYPGDIVEIPAYAPRRR